MFDSKNLIQVVESKDCVALSFMMLSILVLINPLNGLIIAQYILKNTFVIMAIQQMRISVLTTTNSFSISLISKFQTTFNLLELFLISKNRDFGQQNKPALLNNLL